MPIDMELFKRVYNLSHGRSDYVDEAVNRYLEGKDYTSLPDGTQIVDAFVMLGDYLNAQAEQSKSNSGSS